MIQNIWNFSDITRIRCGADYTSGWPFELEDNDLIWTSNEMMDFSGPKIRIFSDVDLRLVEPNTDYKCKILRHLGRATKSLLPPNAKEIEH